MGPRTKTCLRKTPPPGSNPTAVAAQEVACDAPAAENKKKPTERYESVRACDQCDATSVNGGKCKRRTCAYGPYCWQHTQSKLHLKVVDSKVKGAGKGLVAFDPKHKGEKDHVVFADGERNLPGQPASGLITPYQASNKYLTKKQVDEFGENDLLPYSLGIHDKTAKDGVYYSNPYKTNDGLGRYPNDPGWNGKKYDVSDARMKRKRTPVKAVLYEDDSIRVPNPNKKIVGKDNKKLATVKQPWLSVKDGAEIKQGEEIFLQYSANGNYWTDNAKNDKQPKKRQRKK